MNNLFWLVMCLLAVGDVSDQVLFSHVFSMDNVFSVKSVVSKFLNSKSFDSYDSACLCGHLISKNINSDCF